jgi:prepilin-type processing-associated H-X9-DG protein
MKKVKGFKLIDLLAIAAVVVVLACLLIPVLTPDPEIARRAKCRDNLRQIMLAIKSYASDFDGSYPTSAEPDQSIGVGSHHKDLGILYPHYVSSLDLFTCPSCRDRMPNRRRGHIYDGKPLSLIEATQLSYSYGYDGSTGRNRPWTQAAPLETKILADRPASQPIHAHSNHSLEGRNVAFADGHVKWIPGKKKVPTNPHHPDPKLRGESWWSNPYHSAFM